MYAPSTIRKIFLRTDLQIQTYKKYLEGVHLAVLLLKCSSLMHPSAHIQHDSSLAVAALVTAGRFLIAIKCLCPLTSRCIPYASRLAILKETL